MVARDVLERHAVADERISVAKEPDHRAQSYITVRPKPDTSLDLT